MNNRLSYTRNRSCIVFLETLSSANPWVLISDIWQLLERLDVMRVFFIRSMFSEIKLEHLSTQFLNRHSVYNRTRLTIWLHRCIAGDKILLLVKTRRYIETSPTFNISSSNLILRDTHIANTFPFIEHSTVTMTISITRITINIVIESSVHIQPKDLSMEIFGNCGLISVPDAKQFKLKAVPEIVVCVHKHTNIVSSTYEA